MPKHQLPNGEGHLRTRIEDHKNENGQVLKQLGY